MKLVLVDRDGVINKELEGYVTAPEELIILPPALKAFALFKQKNYTPVIITNQSVVGRGIITQAELDAIHTYMMDEVKKHGGEIAEVISCTDKPDLATDRRKPGAGMLLEALQKYGAAAQQTAFIGDALTDLEAATAAGCKRYLVMTGKGEKSMRAIAKHLEPVTICTDILDAARKITMN